MESRARLYKFMLENMTDEDRFKTIYNLCNVLQVLLVCNSPMLPIFAMQLYRSGLLAVQRRIYSVFYVCDIV